MKTPPAAQREEEIITVTPPSAGTTESGALPSEPEATAIVQGVIPHFEHFADQYDTKKYWPEVYETVLQAFEAPAVVPPKMLRNALLWKYGHLGKPAIPAHHERLIKQIQEGWRTTLTMLPAQPEPAFAILNEEFGNKNRFITVAFLLHLLFPREVPIIDQHNFRAVNGLMSDVRAGWRSKKKPSRYSDIQLVAGFTHVVLAVWRRVAPASVPSERDFDKFLMMYGKARKKLPPPS